MSQEKQEWPAEVWIGMAGRPYLSKTPTVLGESGPVVKRYLPEEDRVEGLVAALETISAATGVDAHAALTARETANTALANFKAGK